VRDWRTTFRPGAGMRPQPGASFYCALVGVMLPETAVGALAAQPGCSSVIAGATSAEQVKANTSAAEWIPTAAELAEIDAIVPPPAGP
jgi:aryl-alcohol dehydrogenase-like predicted oxidoreductase